MKKSVSLVLSLIIVLTLFSGAYADVDLSGMSYEELVTLKDQINLAMWNSEEWEEVVVPQGLWHVGEDIPAGHWTISATDGTYPTVKVGTKLDSNGKLGSADIGKANIKSPTRSSYNENEDKTSADFDLPEGAYVYIEDGNVIFTPYQGKPSLGFKKSSSTTKTTEAPIIPAVEENDSSQNTTAYNFDDLFNTLLGSDSSVAVDSNATAGERNALRSAQNYLQFMAFSYSGLIEQLKYEGFSTAEATYAADNCGADWNEQAYKSAKNYLQFMAFSKSSLIEQLEYEGFSHEQAVYGANKAYN